MGVICCGMSGHDDLDVQFPDEEYDIDDLDGLSGYDERDFTLKFADSLPSPVGDWLRDGDKSIRLRKFLSLVFLLVLVLVIILAVILGVTLVVSTTKPDSSQGTTDDVVWESSFLPSWARPSSYVITIRPNLGSYSMQGDTVITFEMLEAGHDVLILNSLDIEISNATITKPDGTLVSISSVVYDEELEMAFLRFPEEIPVSDSLQVHITYHGTIQEEMAGFYRSVYVDEDGQEHRLAATQFEPTAARLAFPCFDEPDMKATFIIKFIFSDSQGTLVALSNMPVAEHHVEAGLHYITFEETPLMSTYLVAFLLGDFASVDGEYKGKPIKVWSPVGQEDEGRVALDVTIGALEFYEDFFGQNYTLPKLDLVAIPDFEAGAMENWGLITFRLTALLYKDIDGTAGNLQRVVTVVTHELAHQWTGDLVTMKWWSDLWLNEGFADYFETESANALYPSWQMRDQFLVEDQQRAFSLDSLYSTRPIVHDAVTTSSDISEMFDTITYSKGGSILRMMQYYLGADVFKSGLQQYIDSYQFNNALTTDLLESLAETTGHPDLKENFHEWLYNPGYPVVTVTMQEQTLTFTQERFISSGDTIASNETELWWLNIHFKTDSGPPQDFSFDTASHQVTLSEPTTYIKANLGQNGFYRVNYPPLMWIQLKNRMQSFSTADRAGLVNDVLVLARAGRLETTTALDFTSFLSDELDYTVWVSALSQLNYIGTMMTTEADYGLFELFLQDVIDEAVDYVGWATLQEEESSHNQSLLRSVLLGEAIRYQLPSAVDQALTIWANFRVNGSTIAPEDRSAVYCAALHYGDSSDYNFLFTRLQATENAAEISRILYSLGCTREYYLLQATLKSSLDSSIVKAQDQRTVISGVYANPLGRDLAWNFVQANFETFNVLGFSLSSLISTVTSSFNDEFHLHEVDAFFKTQNAVGASFAIEQSKETIRSNIQWMDNNAHSVAEWLRTNYQ